MQQKKQNEGGSVRVPFHFNTYSVAVVWHVGLFGHVNRTGINKFGVKSDVKSYHLTQLSTIKGEFVPSSIPLLSWGWLTM